jgi:hypothetical protein
MILIGVFIYTSAKKVVLALHKKAILRCNQKIAKGICAPSRKSFSNGNSSVHRAAKEGASFHKNSQALFCAATI